MRKLPKILSCMLLLAPFSPFSYAAEQTLHFYNWSEYVPASILADFTEETGIKVIYSTYDSNESMYSTLKAQKQDYDLVVPSSYFISKMRKEGMLQPIDRSKLTHFQDLDPTYLNKPFDPENRYSVPYVLGATGIGINVDMLDTSTVRSWNDFWDTKWEGQLMVIDDARELFHIALIRLGYSVNTTDPDKIKAAYEELQMLKPNILVFNSDFPANPYLSGEVSMGMLWNGSAYMARREGANIQIVWPEKGTIFWMDSLAIPADAQHVDAAHKMIDFLLRPEIAARIAQEIGYPTPVRSAYPLLPKAFMEDPSIFPPREVIEFGYWQDDVGEANKLYEEYFQKLKESR